MMVVLCEVGKMWLIGVLNFLFEYIDVIVVVMGVMLVVN